MAALNPQDPTSHPAGECRDGRGSSCAPGPRSSRRCHGRAASPARCGRSPAARARSASRGRATGVSPKLFDDRAGRVRPARWSPRRGGAAGCEESDRPRPLRREIAISATDQQSHGPRHILVGVRRRGHRLAQLLDAQRPDQLGDRYLRAAATTTRHSQTPFDDLNRASVVARLDGSPARTGERLS